MHPSQMNSEQFFDWIRGLFVELFELEAEGIERSTRLVEDLDLDSIDAIDMVVELQSYTEERIDEDVLKHVKTVGDVVDLAARYLGGDRRS
jgi:acyl carrier protein